MRQILIALFAGTLFGAGLAYSGMADPARVQGFLDLFGPWDPTLAFVMGGAMIPMAIAWIIEKQLDRPFADKGFSLPTASVIDRKLMVGALIFGSGWGISGLCPGPGFANLAINPFPALMFVAALLVGMLVHRVTE
ncbi:DUF6691 family protein [Parasphingorhabdus sp. JC815]|uniref:DUF6691 family protein n=1 Tax=Parasphingorhabdus sp. JC815 TaxID=3232140 RepID=UPI003457EF89